MRAVAVFPEARQLRFIEHPEPSIARAGEVKVRLLEGGLCGTDQELASFRYGTPPAASPYLILGHESLGEVVETGNGSALAPGDLVVCAVRRPCPHDHCGPCRAGYQDFCVTHDYAESGIVRKHGYLTEFTIEEPAYLYKVPAALRDVAVLVEPLTIAEKALLSVQSVTIRMPCSGRNAVVLGAGPIGLLGAMALKAAGFEVTVYSRIDGVPERSRIAEAIGARFVNAEEQTADEVSRETGPIDLIYEAAGSPRLTFDFLPHLGPNGIFVATGAGGAGVQVELDAQSLLIGMIRNNQVLLGTVNASPDSFRRAILDLQFFSEMWPDALRALITRRVRMEDAVEAIRHPGGIKTVVEIGT